MQDTFSAVQQSGLKLGEQRSPGTSSEMTSGVRQKVMQTLDSRKDEMCSGLAQLADTLEKSAGEGPMAKMGTAVAGYTRRASDTLRTKSSDELLSMATNEFRSRPTALLAGCFALGFLGARFLRT